MDFELAVIGGGAAGLAAAELSATLGAKTALIEAQRLGGESAWSGSVPSKALLAAARVAHTFRTSDRFGIKPAEPSVDFAQVMENVRHLRQQIYNAGDRSRNVEKLGVEVFLASAQFLDGQTLELTESDGKTRRLSAKNFVIATGTHAVMPPGLDVCLTNESLFELTEQPRSLVIAGAGPMGVEMAQAFRRLGTDVTLVAPGNRILPKDDPELSVLLEERLRREGVNVLTGRRVTNVVRASGSLIVVLSDGSAMDCDCVLSACGRLPNIETLQLANAGVTVYTKGIVVDEQCRTSRKNIFAVGDVTGRFLFAHMAEHMSTLAVNNAILNAQAKLDSMHVVSSTFTDPELARLGLSDEQMKRSGVEYDVYRLPFAKIDRAVLEGEEIGLVKIMAGKNGRILGATILGRNAGEMIAELALAMKHEIPLEKLAATIHAYPTYMVGNRSVAEQACRAHSNSAWPGALGKVFGHRGVRSGAVPL